MSAIKEYLEATLRVWALPTHKFLIEYGQVYRTGPESYFAAEDRMEPKQCFDNATRLALMDSEMTYVEGKVTCYGVPLDHAWCIDRDGLVVDPTLEGHDAIGEYYGVPFRTDYVQAAIRKNAYVGLLDPFYARKTLPKLLELGLEGGQAWLVERPRRSKAGRIGGAAALLLAALLAPPADAQTVYGRDGRVQSRTQTFSDGSTMTQDGRGRTFGTSTTSPTTGAVTVYGSDGRRAATIKAPRQERRR